MKFDAVRMSLLVAVLSFTGCDDIGEPPDYAYDASQSPSMGASDGGGLPVGSGVLDGAAPSDAGSSPVEAAVPTIDASGSGNPGDAALADASWPDASTDSAAPTGDAALGGYSPCPSNGDPCKILPLGDSITDGFGYAGGYRVALFARAQAAMQRITFVGSLQNGPSTVAGASFPRNHQGHPGWTIDRVASLVPRPALESAPDIVLLMAGTNDVNFSSDLANAPNRLGAMIDAISAANERALIVVAQLTPLEESFFNPGAGASVETFNRALPAVVESRVAMGKHVMLVDMHTGFPDGGLGDGVHPNQQGYEWMANVWYAAIAGVLR